MTVTPGKNLSHYRLIDKIGEGGMGVVWKAQDFILGRTVAIKVLPASLALDEERRKMFLDEARLASSVSDAHIAQVFELAREGDLDFIVMEYVEGTSLDKMLRGRPLAAEKIAALGEQVARALSRAHRKGLLHRDIKPANILVTPDGDVKVVDFGLATLFRVEQSAALTDLTTHSVAAPPVPARIMGTLPYMSPEQLRREKLDSRSDVFSLGTVLYEMTGGQRPFIGATNLEVAAEIQKSRPQPLRQLVPQIPMELDRIVQKALAARPADRYQTMEDLAVDLKRLGRELETGSAPSYKELETAAVNSSRIRRTWWVAGGICLAALLLACGWIVRSWRSAGADSHTILILPLEVRGQADGADYVGRAFAEALAMNLAGAKNLTVLPVPEKDEAGQGSARSLVRAALDSGAGRLVTGAVVRDAKGLHASVSLLDSQRNRILWGAQKNADGDDLAGLAASMAGAISTELGVLTPRLYDNFWYPSGSPELAASPEFSASLAALRRMDHHGALASGKRLVESFPDEPQARALRLNSLVLNAMESGPSSPERREFERAAAELTRVDPNTPWVDFQRALLLTFDGRFRDSVAHFTEILSRSDLTPALRASILIYRGQAYSSLQNGELALADLEEALPLDPASDFNLAAASGILMRLGRDEEALTYARSAMAINPESSQNNATLGWCLYDLKKWEEAIPALRKACEINPVQSLCAYHATALLRAGHGAEAKAAAQSAVALPETSDGAYVLACFHALSGDRAGAIRLLRRHDELGPTRHPDLMKENDLFSLHGDSDFEKMQAAHKRAGFN